MNQRMPKPEPRRLIESSDRVAQILRSELAEVATPTASEVLRHWTKFESNLESPARSPIRFYGFAVASTMALVVCIVSYLWSGSHLAKSHSVAEVTTVQPSAPRRPEALDVPLRIQEQETRQLNDGTTVAVAAGGLVTVTHPTAKLTRLELQGGAAEFAVSPRQPGELLEVSAGRFQFRVLGTRFRVAHDPDGVTLSVAEGKVAVLEKDRTLGVVPAGSVWSEKQAENVPSASPPATTTHVSEGSGTTKKDDCLTLARRAQHEAAISCFARQARGTGVSAEVAQYEMARIEHDALGQAERSLETLRSYRERFPNGTLRTEAMLKTIQIWIELGKDDLALKESDGLIRSGQIESRQGELRFLRGKLYQRRGAFAQALTEFAQAAASGGGQSERANLERAGCLEQLGRAEEAHTLYEQLSRSQQGTIRESARKRLSKLESKASGQLEQQ